MPWDYFSTQNQVVENCKLQAPPFHRIQGQSGKRIKFTTIFKSSVISCLDLDGSWAAHEVSEA
jgi:hypothetical protein